VLVLWHLAAQATVSFGNVGEAGAVPALYLTADGKAPRIPGGLAWVYGGRPQATAWTAGKAA